MKFLLVLLFLASCASHHVVDSKSDGSHWEVMGAASNGNSQDQEHDGSDGDAGGDSGDAGGDSQ